jgi:hypothetical protein
VALQAVKKWLTVLTVLIFGTWLVGGLLLLQHGVFASGAAPAQAAAAAALVENPAVPQSAASGPWGRIQYMPIAICPPLELVPELTPAAAREVLWRFSSTKSADLSARLDEIGLSEPLHGQLLSLAKADPAIDGFVVRPGRELILGLSPADRSKLYIALSACQANFDQVKAFRFSGERPEEWFADTAVSQATKDLVWPLLYRYRGFWFFADLRSIEESLSSSEERQALLSALSREATFQAKLKVDKHSDVDALVKYWGRGGREKDVHPLIESLAKVEGGGMVDVALLLPTFARQRMYRYPDPPEKGVAVNHDCHWSAFNFFSAEPDDRFCETAEIARTLKDEYYRVYGDYRLGDLVLYFSNNESFVHSCVYIADDFVFTKNGNLSSRPWMLMKLKDMQNFYPSIEPLEVRFYRRKDI